MAEVDFVSFGVWSAITLVVIVITSLVYRKYKRKHAASSS
jgi:hypothetical protein